MDEKIYSISLLTFDSKIYFYQKRSEFLADLSQTFSKKIMDILRKNYLKQYLSKNNFYRHMDYTINSYIKAKISLIGKICTVILYSSNIDVHFINLFNDGMRMAICYLCKTKRIKIEYLMRRNLEVNQILMDTIYFINPNFRLLFKINDYSIENAALGYYNIFFQRFSFGGNFIRKVVYNQCSEKFSKNKGELVYNRNLNEENKKISIKLNEKMKNFFIERKNKFLEFNKIDKKLIVNEEENNNKKHKKNIKITIE